MISARSPLRFLVLAAAYLAAADPCSAAGTARLKTQAGRVAPAPIVGLLTPLSAPSVLNASSLLAPSGAFGFAAPQPLLSGLSKVAATLNLPAVNAVAPAALGPGQSQAQIPVVLSLPQIPENQAVASINSWAQATAKENGSGSGSALRLEKLFTGRASASQIGFGETAAPASLNGLPAEQRLKPYDFHEHKMAQDDRIGLIIAGYRFDEKTGRILSPGSQAALTYQDLAKIRVSQAMSRRYNALERIWQLVNQPGSGKDSASWTRIAKIVDNQKDVLPANAAKPWQDQDFAAFKEVIDRRYYSLARLYDHAATLEGLLHSAKPLERSEADTKDSYFDENERRLGQAIQKELIGHFSANAEGAKLLAELGGRLPSLRILKLDDRYSAFYSPGEMQIVLNFDSVARRILAGVKPGAPAPKLDTSEELSDYLLRHPEAIRAFLEAEDVTIFHEHVHFKQDLQGTFFREATRGNIAGVMLLENEHEAYFRENVYLHHKLAADASAIASPWLDDYIRMLQDFEGWRAGIDQRYQDVWPAFAADLRTARELQIGRSKLLEWLGSQADAFMEKLKMKRLGIWRGLRSLRAEQALADRRLAEFKEAWPKLRLDGFQRLAELFAQRGEWNSSLACLWRVWEGAPEQQAGALRASLEKTAAETLRWAGTAPSPALQQRLDVIWYMSSAMNALGKPWPYELWALGASTFAEAAKTNPAYAGELERWKGLLRSYVADYMRAASAEKDPLRRQADLDAAKAHAQLVGDPALTAEIEQALRPDGPSKGGPRNWLRPAGQRSLRGPDSEVAVPLGPSQVNRPGR